MSNNQIIFRHLNQFFKFLLKRIYVLFIVIAIFIYLFYQKAQEFEENYSAALSFMLAEEELGNSAGSFNLASQLGLVNQNASNNKVILKELLDSRKLFEHTLFYEVKLNGKTDILINHYAEMMAKTYNSSNFRKLDKNYHIGDSDEIDTYIANTAFELKNRYNSTMRESGLFDLTFKAPNDRFTKLFLETHLESISDYYKLKRTQRALTVLKYAQKRTDSLSSVLAGKDYAVASSADNNMLGILSTTKVPEIRQKRNVEIISKLYSEAIVNLETAKMSVAKETPMLQIVDDIRFPLQFNKKPTSKNITIGSIIGVIIGLVLTLLWYVIANFKQLMSDVASMQKKPEQNSTPAQQ